MFRNVICGILIILQFPFISLSGTHLIKVSDVKSYQTFEGFGTSSCWWAHTIDDENTASELADLLYDDEKGLGLKTYRYNIGGGEDDLPESNIWSGTRKPQSFYVFNSETNKWEFDFTRDVNSRRMLDAAIKSGAEEVILFCNSPHYSMTANGHTYATDYDTRSNLPRENYQAFVDYVLTIADKFVEWGYPIKAISPINEPQWTWSAQDSNQEGCHYEVDECIELLELFAVNMKKRNSPYALLGPESGQLTWEYYDYVDAFMQSEILRDYCEYYAGHSYWMDDNRQGKKDFGSKLQNDYPDMKFDMSEWCELPMTRDNMSIDSGLLMARTIAQDLSLMNAVSWSTWTAFQGDGLMDRGEGGSIILLKRYYAYMQFTRFIKPGMVRMSVYDSAKVNSTIDTCCFQSKQNRVMVLVNSGDEQQLILAGLNNLKAVYITDADHNCEPFSPTKSMGKFTIPANCILTFVAEL